MNNRTGTGGGNILPHTVSHFFQENTKPNLVFRLWLGTTLRLLKLMNSGEMSSNCRLFFISLQSFSTKIFKAVFPQLLCNTSNHRSVEYVENAPNKYCCHRPSARKYETGASFSQNQVKTNARLCFIFVFGKRGGRLRVHAQPGELTYLATQRAKQASRDNASFCKLTQKRRHICGLLSF